MQYFHEQITEPGNRAKVKWGEQYVASEGNFIIQSKQGQTIAPPDFCAVR